MTTIQKLIAGICILSVPFFNACGDDDPSTCNWATEVQEESEAATAALNAYTADPTNTVKCNEFKAAYTTYLNALDDHTECAATSGQEDELQSAINNAQAAINSIQC